MVASVAPRSLGTSQVIKEVATSSKSEEQIVINGESLRTDRADAAKIDRAIERAKNSTAAIIEIRESQSALLEKIQSTNDSKKVELISEFNSLNSEIARITSNSTYNGTNLTEGSLFQLQSARRLYYGVVSLPRYSSLNSVDTLQNTTASIASTVTSLETVLSSAYILDGGISSRDLKSQKIISDLSRSSYPIEDAKRNKFSSNSLTTSEASAGSGFIKVDPVTGADGLGNDVDIIV